MDKTFIVALILIKKNVDSYNSNRFPCVEDFYSTGTKDSFQSFTEALSRVENYIAGYEAGYFGYGIQQDFESLGMKCLVLHPVDIPTTQKDNLFTYF